MSYLRSHLWIGRWHLILFLADYHFRNVFEPVVFFFHHFILLLEPSMSVPKRSRRVRNINLLALSLLGNWLRALLKEMQSTPLFFCQKVSMENYLQDIKGISCNLSHHSSVITILRSYLSSHSTLFLYLLAWLTSSWTYSQRSVLRTLKKQSLSGTLPFGSL